MRKKKHEEHVNHERWLISYADFITLLFAFFVVLFSVSQVDGGKMGRFQEAFQSAIGVAPTPFGAGVMPGEAQNPKEGKDDPDGKGGGNNGKGANSGELPAELQGLRAALSEHAKNNEDLSGLKVLRRRNELVLRLSEGVVFDSGDDKVQERAIKTLLAIANEVKNRKVNIRVEGHTDNVPIKNGRFRSNWELSTARATMVINEIAERAGISPDRLAAAGYGEFHPVSDNETSEGRAQNRRVDLVVATADSAPVQETEIGMSN